MTTSNSPRPISRPAGYLLSIAILILASVVVALPLTILAAPDLSRTERATSFLAVGLLYWTVYYQCFVVPDLRGKLRNALSAAATWEEIAKGNEEHIHFLSDALQRRNNALTTKQTATLTPEGAQP